jgi:hypothetical protein
VLTRENYLVIVEWEWKIILDDTTYNFIWGEKIIVLFQCLSRPFLVTATLHYSFLITTVDFLIFVSVLTQVLHLLYYRSSLLTTHWLLQYMVILEVGYTSPRKQILAFFFQRRKNLWIFSDLLAFMRVQTRIIYTIMGTSWNIRDSYEASPFPTTKEMMDTVES